MSKVIGSIKVREEETEIDFVDYLSLKHENRIVHVVKCENGNIGIHTIRETPGEEPVQTGYLFSRETFSMLLSAMMLCAGAWKIDFEGFMSMVADGNNDIHFEFGDLEAFGEYFNKKQN